MLKKGVVNRNCQYCTQHPKYEASKTTQENAYFNVLIQIDSIRLKTVTLSL